MMMNWGLETVNDFAKAIALEPERIAMKWWGGYHYRNNGYYARNLAHYFNLFSKSQIKIILLDDLVSDASATMQSIYRFLEVDDAVVPDTSKRLNEGGTIPLNASLVAFLRSNRITKALRRHAKPIYQPLKRAAKSTLIKPAVLAPELRDELTQSYREDILRLQDMIGRDLSHWLKSEADSMVQSTTL
jgi:hypothetical protein